MSLQRHPVARRFHLFPDGRQLLWPLSISLLIHALVWWQAPGPLPLTAAPTTRNSDLRASLQAGPVVEPPPLEQRAGSPTEPPAAAPVRQPKERSYAPRPPEPVPPSAAAAEPVQEQAGPEVLPSTPIEPLRTGIDVVGLRQYHLALGRKARQFRRYPQAAREAGWQGRVALRLAVSETGAPIGISLLRSSNFPLIDQAALEMMFLASGHTEVPESLRGRAFTIDLAVDFNPEDAP